MKETMTLIALVIAIAGCAAESVDDGKLDVIVSILPQQEFAEAVGGDLVTVRVLIPEGGSPELYDPGPGDLATVERSDIWFQIGHIPFENANAGRIMGLNPDLEAIDTSEGVKLRSFSESEVDSHDEVTDAGQEDGHDHEGEDFHIWLSPVFAKTIVENIYAGLSEADPENAEVYRENADAYLERLDELDMKLTEQFQGARGRKILVFHPAWGYFTDRYGLVQVAIENDGKDPAPQDIVRIIDLAREEEITVIFVQEQMSAEVAASIADEIGATVVSIDPLAKDYLENMEMLGDSIYGALR